MRKDLLGQAFRPPLDQQLVERRPLDSIPEQELPAARELLHGRNQPQQESIHRLERRPTLPRVVGLTVAHAGARKSGRELRSRTPQT